MKKNEIQTKTPPKSHNQEVVGLASEHGNPRAHALSHILLELFLEMLPRMHGPIRNQALVGTASKALVGTAYEKVLFINNDQAPSKREWSGRPAAENVTTGGLSVVFWTVQSSSQQFVLKGNI